MGIVIKSLVEIPKSLLDEKRIQYIKKALTFEVQEYMSDNIIQIATYEEKDDSIAIPRFFADSVIFCNQEFRLFAKNETVVKFANVNFKWEKDNHPNKDLQNDILERICQAFQRTNGWFDGGIVYAFTGFGKTLLGLKLIDRLKLKTLIIVHRKILLEQWCKFIQEFTDLKEEDIGIVDADVFVYDKPVTVGMLQTILSRDLTEDFNQSFGLVIVDEASHISAQKWWEVAKKICARYTLGLTGVKKSNSLYKILEYTLGTKTFTQIKVKVTGEVDVYPYTFYIGSAQRFDCKYAPAIISNMIVNNQHFNMFLAKILKYYVTQNRYVLIVTTRVKHAELLYKLCQGMFPNKLFQLLIGGVTKIEYVDGYVGTMQYIAEGINIPHIDTLILTLPVAGIKQVCGRLFRNLDKKTIKIVDVYLKTFPALKVFDEMFIKRKQAYKNWDMNINLIEEI